MLVKMDSLFDLIKLKKRRIYLYTEEQLFSHELELLSKNIYMIQNKRETDYLNGAIVVLMFERH